MMEKCDDNILIEFEEMISKDYRLVNKENKKIFYLLAFYIYYCPSRGGPEKAKKLKYYNLQDGVSLKKFKKKCFQN